MHHSSPDLPPQPPIPAQPSVGPVPASPVSSPPPLENKKMVPGSGAEEGGARPHNVGKSLPGAGNEAAVHGSISRGSLGSSGSGDSPSGAGSGVEHGRAESQNTEHQQPSARTKPREPEPSNLPHSQALPAKNNPSSQPAAESPGRSSPNIPDEHALQSVLSDLKENFGPFYAQAKHLENRLLTWGEKPASLKGHLDSGATSDVFVSSDGEHVIKFPLRAVLNQSETSLSSDDPLLFICGEQLAKSLAQGIGVSPDIEQIVAYHDVEPTAVVTQRVRGNNLAKVLTSPNPPNISRAAMERLVRETYPAMQDNGLIVDNTCPKNSILTTDGRLAVVDFGTWIKQGFLDKVVSFAGPKVLLWASRGHDLVVPVTDQALMYRQVVKEYVGAKAVRAINAVWGENGYSFPEA